MIRLAIFVAAALIAPRARRSAEIPSGGPRGCQLLDAEQRKCAFGPCDKRTVERLRNECLRDRGRP
jgi:hypothetical protein